MTQFLVIDASVAVRCVLPGVEQSRCIQLVEDWRREGYTLCAPRLWAYELTSAVNKLVHFGQIERDEALDALFLADMIGVELIIPTLDHRKSAFDWARRLNRAAAYDCFYLSLAESLGCDFWTADLRLGRSVNQPWIKTIAD